MSKQVAYIAKGCVACGNCAQHCPFGAIHIHRGIYAMVAEDICRGCTKCVSACPAHIIQCKKLPLNESAQVAR